MKHSLNPKPSTLILLILTVLSVVSCSTPRMATTVVRETTKDTLYLSNVQYDSIYVYQGVEKDYRRDFHQPSSLNPQPLVDTIYIRDVQYEYKYKFLRDTVYKVQVDTIPVIKTVEVVKTERYVPGIYKWSLAICIILFCVFCVFCVLKIKF